LLLGSRGGAAIASVDLYHRSTQHGEMHDRLSRIEEQLDEEEEDAWRRASNDASARLSGR